MIFIETLKFLIISILYRILLMVHLIPLFTLLNYIEIQLMTSAVKRQQLVNELRKAHFSFGYADGKDNQSEYIHEYKQRMLANNHKKQGNPREHHYQLGTDDTHFLSEFKHRYPQHTNHQPVALSEDKKKDLRRQHFVLGYDQQLPNSTYTQQYYKKDAQVQPNDESANVRKHMHDFGDSLTYFSSVYKQTFNKNLQGFKPPEKVPIDANALRRTNMILGNKSPDYQTQNSITYVNRSASTVKPIKAPDTGISFGNDRDRHQSSNKTDYGHKFNPAVKIDRDTIKDFRSAHFKLGSSNTPNNYLSQNKRQYGEKPLDSNGRISRPDDNVNLGMDYPNDYNSIYKGNYHGLPSQQVKPIKPSGELSGLGTDPRMFQTQAKANFTKHPLDPTSSFRQKGDKCNLQLGSGPMDYSTQYKDVHRDRFNQLKKNELSRQQIENLKAKHFQHGYKGANYDTSNSYYGREQGPPGSLTEEQLESIKRPNIYDVDPDTKKNTIYKTSFHWKANKQY